MIDSEVLKVDFLNRIAEKGNMVAGLSDPIYQNFLNAAIRDLVLDAVANKTGMNPVIANVIRQSLTGGTRQLTGNDILLGTAFNGALRAYDEDMTQIENASMPPQTKYAFLVPLPEEVFVVISRSLDTFKNGITYPLVDVEAITLEKYNQLLTNKIRQPQDGYAWSYIQNAKTVAGTNFSVVGGVTNTDWDKPLQNANYASMPGLKGMSIGVPDVKNLTPSEPKEITVKATQSVEQLILKQGWVPLQYTVQYYSRPASIVISRVANLRKHSDLPDIVRNEIVDYAVTRYIASLAAEPAGAEINNREKSNQ